MWRTFVDRMACRHPVAQRSYPLEQRPTQLLEIHDAGLLARHDLIEFVEKLVLVRQSCFEFDEAVFAHPGHLSG